MKLEDQVCSLDLAKKLKELGVKQESYFFWSEIGNDTTLHWFRDVPKDFGDQYAAFTVAELGEMLPYSIVKSIKMPSGFWSLNTSTTKENGKVALFEANTEADARAKMLIYLIENNLLKVESKTNQPES